MSKQYDLYLEQHRSNVAKGYNWMRENIPEIFNDIPENAFCIFHEFQICYEHDKSKDLADEYSAYDAYFYGGNRSFEVVQDFRNAWLRHIHRNEHHWQHWVLINDDPNEGEIIMDMPYNCIIEMICDWWAFSWNKEKLDEIFGWYDEHKDYIKLSAKTRSTVESILNKMKEKLEEVDNV